MNRYQRRLAVAALAWLALAQAQTPAPDPSHRITPNIQNTDIAVVADLVGQSTGLSFIVDPRVRATVNLINPQPMTPQQLYERFLSILQVYGAAAVRCGNVVKVVPEANVRQMANCNQSQNVNPDSDEMITTVIEVKNISAQQLNVTLRQLIPATSSMLQWVSGTNTLLITDHASNVARIKKIVAELDQAGGSGIDMIPLSNSNASDVARTLTTLLASAPAEAAGGGAPKVVADDRSNSILVSGDEAARKRVADIVADLDKPVADDDNIETRRLKYARAEDVATVLKAQAGTIVASTSGNAGAQAGAAATTTSSASDRTVNIQADKNTNTLIISAPPKTRRALMRIVDQLDIARAQVLIEAIIADISVDKTADLGVNWAVFSQANGKIIPGALFDSAIGTAAGSPIDLAGVAKIISSPSSATSAPAGATVGIGRLNNNGISWAAMLRALNTDSNTNVIAQPEQLTLDNEEVTLQSGQNVPFVTGQYTNTGGNNNGSVNPFTTVQRQDIGTTLKITPQLNGSDAMTLTIDLESSELAGQTGDAGSQITNKRTFHNVVLVKDKQWIVVGGLTRDSQSGGGTRVPFLSRIPLLGELFKTKNNRRSKSNLMVFIRPSIVTDNADLNAETSSKYQEVQDAQSAQGKSRSLPPPRLPPIEQPADSPAPSASPGAKAPQTSPVP